MPLKTVIESHRTNAPLLSDLPCSGIVFVYKLSGAGGGDDYRHRTKKKIQRTVIQCRKKVIMHPQIDIKPYRTNAPLSLDFPCSGI